MLRKSFFIKPKLQLNYLFMSVLLTIVSAGIVYLTLVHTMMHSERLSEISNFEIEAFKTQVSHAFVWVVIFLMIAFGLESMFRFHRLIGPIYVIEKIVNALAAGDLTQDFHLRKHDELKDLVDELIAMKNQLKNFIESDRKTCKNISDKLTRISQALERGESTANLKQEIQAVQKELTAVTSQFKI